MSDVRATVTLSTADLETIVSEWMAKRLGVPTPVAYRAEWGWSPGRGPVLVKMEVESVPNVVKIGPRPKAVKDAG